MDDKLLVALIAGGVSLVVSLLGHWLGPRGQKAVERMKAELQEDLQRQLEDVRAALADRNSAAAARRDYEYEARKRLYQHVEPLLFQLYEALEEAHYRVRSLVRTATQGHLGRRCTSSSCPPPSSA